VSECADKAQSTKIEPEWKGQKPVCPIQRVGRARAELLKKAAVLSLVLAVVQAKWPAIRAASVKEDRVEFVIAHNSVCMAS
jgi:hypothetical protein